MTVSDATISKVIDRAAGLSDDSLTPSAASLRLSKPVSKRDADPDQPIDAAAWRSKLKLIGKVTKASTVSAIESLSLPAVIPAVRRDVRVFQQNFAASHEDLAECLSQDPALLSVLIGQTQGNPLKQSCDILQALQGLSQEGLEELIDNVEVEAAFLSASARPWSLYWWCHSMAVAHLSGELAMAMDIDPATARLAGFLHDIGRLALLSTKHASRLISTYELAGKMTFPTIAAESTLLGLDHRQAGMLYCTRCNLPPAIRNICETHDLDDAMRDQLEEPEQRLSAVVAAADLIAKAVGMGSLPDDELAPLPASMAQAVTELSISIDTCLAQVQTLCYWRAGHSGVHPLPDDAMLTGKQVLYVGCTAGPWNPVVRLFMRSGASVSWYNNVKKAMDCCPTADLLVMDYSDSSLQLAMPLLCRLDTTGCLSHMPKLLLARSAEDPQGRVRQAELNIKVMPTPIRTLGLLQLAKQTIG